MDTIGNMLTSIRNAQAVGKQTVSVPYSKIKMDIAKILAKEKFIKEADHKGKKVKKTIDMILAYDDLGRPAISNIKRVSKPSRRVYSPSSKIKKIRQGFGFQILSTPKGVITGKEAVREKVGGEIICEIY
ncbi:MAG: 30S ribosomal protein S8 [Patescibacteria group bacterium]